MSFEFSTNKFENALHPHPHFNRSSNMQAVLSGSPQVNQNYFIDSLERFKKDYASFSKEERESYRLKRANVIQNKQQRHQQFLDKFQTSHQENIQKQQMQQSYSQQLLNYGLKKNGMTNGMPVNPINHQYQVTKHGQQFQQQENEKRLNDMVRMHHLQKRGTCGYNLINGKQNERVENLVALQQKPGIQSRIKQYQDYYSLKAPYN